ncbi:MAG: ABC transporter permease [Candidatus Thorarchaeota archaeon]
MRLRKLRAGLTTLGVVIGITAIVALLSLTQGFQIALTQQFEEGFAADTLTVTTRSSSFPLGSSGSSDFSLYVNDTALIESLDHVDTVTPIISKTCESSTDDGGLYLTVTGVDYEQYKSIFSGTFVAEHGEIPSNPANDSLVIGYRLHDPWKNGTVLLDVGDTVNITYSTRVESSFVSLNYTATVVAVLEEIGGFNLGPSDTGAYIPLATAQDFFDTDKVDSIYVKVDDDDEVVIDAVTEEILDAFDDSVNVIVPTAMLDTITSALDTVQIFMGGIAAISLLVAGIGIMNIMIVSLMERTREIGILKALGMKGRTVLGIFLAEALTIGVLGGVMGIGFGYVVSIFVSRIISGPTDGGTSIGIRRALFSESYAITPVLTPSVALMALFFGIVVSLVFGAYPAWKASRLQPVDALRYE